MDLTFHLMILTALAAIVGAVAAYRRVLASHEDHYIHLHDNASDTAVVSQQQAVARKLEVLDRATKLLAILLGLYAVVALAMALYFQWVQSTTP